jgi:hypothetical protein
LKYEIATMTNAKRTTDRRMMLTRFIK